MTASTIPDLTKLDQLGNSLLPALNTLRETDPVAWNEGVQAWMILRYEDVLAGFEGKLPLSSQAMSAESLEPLIHADQQQNRIPNIVNRAAHWLVNTDPPDHSRFRRALMKGFKPKDIESIRPKVQRIIEEMLARMAAKPECDFVEEVREVTVRVIMSFIGIPDGQFEKVKALSDEITDTFTRPFYTPDTLQRSEAALEATRQIFVAEIAKRRVTPGDDFLSLMVKLVDETSGMTDEELIAHLMLMLPAGHDSTTNTVVLGFVTLLGNPEFRQRFMEDTENLASNVMELMRYIAMSAAMNRVATEDFELHGKKISKGQRVLLMIASANRDPRYFKNAEAINPESNRATPLVFGGGIHHCLGHLVAKMEVTELLPAVLKQFPDAALKDEHLMFNTALNFRGLKYLWVYPYGKQGLTGGEH